MQMEGACCKIPVPVIAKPRSGCGNPFLFEKRRIPTPACPLARNDGVEIAFCNAPRPLYSEAVVVSKKKALISSGEYCRFSVHQRTVSAKSHTI